MALSLESLLKPLTKDEVKNTTISLLQSAHFPVTNWVVGGVARTLVEVFAVLFSDLSNRLVSVAKAGFLDQAEGEWLTFIAKSWYQIERKPPVFTRGWVRLTDNGGGPFTIAAGDLVAVSLSGQRFTNIGGGTLTLNGTLYLVFQAENPGAKFNVAENTITELVTSLAGVTVTNINPVQPGDWVTQQGADEENDESLITRCKAKWPEMGSGGGTDLVWQAWALAGSTEVVKARASVSTTPGTVDVILAGSSGPVSPTAVSDVDAYIATRKPLCVQSNVQSAIGVTVQISGIVYVRAKFRASAEAKVAQNLERLIRETDLGGIVRRAQIIEEIMSPDGVVDVTLSAPSSNVQLAVNEVASLSTALTFINI